MILYTTYVTHIGLLTGISTHQMSSASLVLKLLRVSRLPILSQLYLEEALLRNTKDNWCIISDGAFAPAIVMGISG